METKSSQQKEVSSVIYVTNGNTSTASGRPDKAVHEALVKHPCKALLFMCAHCHQKGSIMRRLMQHEKELRHVHSKQLASMRSLEQAEAHEQ